MSLPRKSLQILPALALSAAIAQAQVYVTTSKPMILSGSLAELQIQGVHKDAVCAVDILEPGGGALTVKGGQHFYLAPEVDDPTTYHLRVQVVDAPWEFAVVPMRVLPRARLQACLPRLAEFPVVVEQLFPKHLGTFWMADQPALHLLAGSVERPREAEPLFERVTAIRFVPEAQGMGTLGGKWLVAGDHGINVLSPSGAATPLLPVARGVAALAVRPAGAANGAGLPLVVYAHNVGDSGAVFGLYEDGQIHLLAGELEPRPGDPPFRAGLGADARLGIIGSLDMDPDGQVFVADRGNQQVLTISPAGAVALLAGNPAQEALAAVDGKGAEASFQSLHALVLDPATRDLYVTDASMLRKITPEGVTTTILGTHGEHALLGLAPDQEVPPGLPGLGTGVDLQLHRGHLFVADLVFKGVKLLNLSTFAMKTLFGEGLSYETRMGPLQRDHPDLAPERCASLDHVGGLGLHPDGTCLVGLDYGVASLDWTAQPRVD